MRRFGASSRALNSSYAFLIPTVKEVSETSFPQSLSWGLVLVNRRPGSRFVRFGTAGIQMGHPLTKPVEE